MSRRTLILAAALLLVLLALSTPLTYVEEVDAATRCGTEITYYADASLTEVVGVYGWLPMTCGCQSYSWGTFSPYRTVDDSFC